MSSAPASPFPERPAAPPAVPPKGSNISAPDMPPPASLGEHLLASPRTLSIPAYLAPSASRIALKAALLGVLAGLCLPRALGMTGLVETSQTTWLRPQLHFYLAAWSIFHLLEFYITAVWNATRLLEDSFLLQNGIGYHLAHSFGLIEYIVTGLIWPASTQLGWWSYLGLVMMLFGQTARSLAMVHAAGNFSHEVAHAKRNDHQLVTTGFYAYTRHPSYVGFFYWALGTQILLGNPVSSCVFAVVLWRFFSARIAGEERSLRAFFPDYKEYAERVGTGLPFIK